VSLSGFFGNDFAVFPNVYRRAVHARRLAGDFSGTAQGSANSGGKFFTRFGSGSSFHGDLSNKVAVLPELSYTLQASAKRRYRFSKLFQLRLNRRSTSMRGTLWPPCLTLAAMRRRASCGECSRR